MKLSSWEAVLYSLPSFLPNGFNEGCVEEGKESHPLSTEGRKDGIALLNALVIDALLLGMRGMQNALVHVPRNAGESTDFMASNYSHSFDGF